MEIQQKNDKKVITTHLSPLRTMKKTNRYPYDLTIAFSAVMRSCSGRKSLFPPKAGIVELWASFVAADLNIIERDELEKGV
jgi:hypothetical protein